MKTYWITTKADDKHASETLTMIASKVEVRDNSLVLYDKEGDIGAVIPLSSMRSAVEDKFVGNNLKTHN